PGHQDFSEDTYRTLTAADSAVMLIDGAKGVEEQTRKLFHVCRMRGIPIFTFVNKLDRFCKDPFELMQEIETALGICSYPVNWPIGAGDEFKGVYNRKLKRIELFAGSGQNKHTVNSTVHSAEQSEFPALLGSYHAEKLKEDIELLDIAGDDFDIARVLAGELTPMFFGSAMTNFGVQGFLDEFIALAPSPGPSASDKGPIAPDGDEFSGFVFKIQANMDAAHRDRIAFIKICSGTFEKGIQVNHQRTGKAIRLTQPQQFFAQERTMVEEAYAGDIIGIFDPGMFNIGDTLYAGKKEFRFEGIPMFSPEHFATVMTKNALKRKQFLKGIAQIAEEGAIQVFKRPNMGVETLTIGVVGVMQFEVLEYRMKHEYGVEIVMERLPYKAARWILSENVTKEMLGFTDTTLLVEDRLLRPVVLLTNLWILRRIEEKNKEAKFLEMAPSS
ncbi:MAG: peptide chain release factor 3, partial [Synergistetes bacterium HGW-Synergistetes-2]